MDLQQTIAVLAFHQLLGFTFRLSGGFRARKECSSAVPTEMIVSWLLVGSIFISIGMIHASHVVLFFLIQLIHSSSFHFEQADRCFQSPRSGSILNYEMEGYFSEEDYFFWFGG